MRSQSEIIVSSIVPFIDDPLSCEGVVARPALQSADDELMHDGIDFQIMRDFGSRKRLLDEFVEFLCRSTL